LAKWTIAIGLSEPPRESFPDVSGKPPFALKMMAFRRNGHLEGVTEFCRINKSQLAGLALALPPVRFWETEIFQSGAHGLRGMSCRSGSWGIAFSSDPRQSFSHFAQGRIRALARNGN